MADLPQGVTALEESDPSVLGPYHVLGRLGEGGMGSVYLGRRDGTGPFVAIKVVRADLARVPEFRERFLREANAAQRVAHAATAPVVDVDTAGSRPYLVTEYIEGPTLDARIRDRGPLSAAELEWLATAVATALRAIHAAGLVHRDLKPSNILLSPFGARVIDFGISRAMDSTTMLTEGTIGTPAFMAPEQALSQPVSETADIHAWGAVLAYAAAGRPPFSGDSLPGVMLSVAYDPPVLDGLPVGLRPLVARAMAKNPADRPTAAELFDLLHSPRPTAPLAEPADAAPPAPAGSPDRSGVRPSTPPPAYTGKVSSRDATARFETPAGGADLVTSYAGQPSHQTVVQRKPRQGRTTIALVAALVAAGTVTVALLTNVLGSGGSGSSVAPTAKPSVAPTFALPTGAGRALAGPTDKVQSVALSPDGHTLAAGSVDQRIYLWDVTRPASPVSLGQPLTGPGSWVSSVAFSPDSHTLAVGSDDRRVYLWDVTRPASPTPLGQPLTEPGDWVRSVAFSPDGHTLAAGSGDGKVYLWSITGTGATALGQPLQGPGSSVRAVAFSPDGHTLAIGGYNHEIALWDVTRPASPTPLGQPLTGPTDFVLSVAFSPNSHTLAASSGDGKIYLWDVTRPSGPTPLGQPLVGSGGSVRSVAFSPDGRALAAAGDNGTVSLWDVTRPASPTPVGQPLTGPGAAVTALAFSPRNGTLVASSEDRTVYVW
ncbi:serine/threonine protein kinase [Frankia sp. AgB1.9]|uniref:WD40 repeat domain-containing serine/threonine protein kinase n=1 Tax=unclassified Frankia TaxID=2632575 RepID=UPI001932C440|nr:MULTISPECIES: serine/threonine-protein kinase [unclassified Frankia]MBL7492578.1 serine/threonine protein kinase [Frankia sp. AgW1.1]MBL7548731.1 serine/threonine protein kinase [Frankia sp. AgB1.9]MBL7619329.1 serine/threonine protein kinase [Frankia sp. AgB1.8]